MKEREEEKRRNKSRKESEERREGSQRGDVEETRKAKLRSLGPHKGRNLDERIWGR